jgi:ATP adenylyltransferase
MPTAYNRLRAFVEKKMRMSHVYQPVMLTTLLRRGGSATARQIAAAILAHDESQLEYYEQIVKNMPGRVLSTHRVVERTGDRYHFTDDYTAMSSTERRDLIGRCQAAIATFKDKRGKKLWENRRPGLGLIPGRARYETLKRAGYRCELCGVSADERALDVDHILPKSKGGADTLENFQALCWLCNTNKGAGDDADFRDVRASYQDRRDSCPFCDPGPGKVVAENSLALLLKDNYPVTPGHLLAVPRRHVDDYFATSQAERKALDRLLEQGRSLTLGRDKTVAAFNVGLNAGQAAGQTVAHCHVHLIPRRAGDMKDPRGGVRGVIPSKQAY